MSAFLRFIDHLVTKGSVPAARVPRNVQCAIQPMVDDGLIVLEKYGRGARYVLMDSDSLEHFLKEKPPVEKTRESKRDRNNKVSATNSKRSLALGAITVKMRCFSGKLTYPDVNIEAQTMTRSMGDISAQIFSDTPLRMEWRNVGIVDNLELFYYVEHIDKSLDGVLFAGRHLHNALLDWLGKQDKSINYIYFGAYSPVGAMKYLHLKERLDANVSYYIPDHVEGLFSRYLNRTLLTDHVEDWRKVRTIGDPAIRKLVSLIASHGGGVGQEALLMWEG